jgi:hypothetical protein
LIVSTAVLIILALLFYRAVWHDVPTLVSALDHCDDLFCDFTRQYYPTGRDIFDSGIPNGGYFYTSFFAIFLAVFGQFDQQTAVTLWGIFQFTSLLLMLLPGLYFFNKQPSLGILYVALLLFSMPVLHNLKWGQVSTFITGAVFAFIYLNRRGYSKTGAVILGLATAVKYYAILFALYHFLSRQRRVILILVVSALLFVIIIPLLVLGWNTNLAFYQTVSERIAHTRETLIPNDPNSQYLGNVLNRFTADIWQTTVNPFIWRMVGFALIGFSVLCLAWIVRYDWPEADHWHLALLFLVVPFFTETSWPHYFVYLPFVEVFLLWQLWQRTWLWRVIGGVIVGTTAVVTSMPYFGWLNNRQVYARYGTLFWVDFLLFALLMALILPRFWQQFRQESSPVNQPLNDNVPT